MLRRWYAEKRDAETNQGVVAVAAKGSGHAQGVARKTALRTDGLPDRPPEPRRFMARRIVALDSLLPLGPELRLFAAIGRSKGPGAQKREQRCRRPWLRITSTAVERSYAAERERQLGTTTGVGATITRTRGLWEGVAENSLTYEIAFAPSQAEPDLSKACRNHRNSPRSAIKAAAQRTKTA